MPRKCDIASYGPTPGPLPPYEPELILPQGETGFQATGSPAIPACKDDLILTVITQKRCLLAIDEVASQAQKLTLPITSP